MTKQKPNLLIFIFRLRPGLELVTRIGGLDFPEMMPAPLLEGVHKVIHAITANRSVLAVIKDFYGAGSIGFGEYDRDFFHGRRPG